MWQHCFDWYAPYATSYYEIYCITSYFSSKNNLQLCGLNVGSWNTTLRLSLSSSWIRHLHTIHELVCTVGSCWFPSDRHWMVPLTFSLCLLEINSFPSWIVVCLLALLQVRDIRMWKFSVGHDTWEGCSSSHCLLYSWSNHSSFRRRDRIWLCPSHLCFDQVSLALACVCLLSQPTSTGSLVQVFWKSVGSQLQQYALWESRWGFGNDFSVWVQGLITPGSSWKTINSSDFWPRTLESWRELLGVRQPTAPLVWTSTQLPRITMRKFGCLKKSLMLLFFTRA